MTNDDDIIDTEATTTTLLQPDTRAIEPAKGLASGDAYQAQLGRWQALIKSGALPAHVSTPQQAVAIAAMGAELGWSPMKSLRSIYLVKGNPQISSQAMLGLVYERLPSAEIDTVQNDSEAAVIKARRGPHDSWSEFSFTLADAKRAGLTSKRGGVWDAYTQDMLWARAVSRMCKRKFPDVVQGCYVVGELESVAESKPQSRRGEVNEGATALLLGQAAPEDAEVVE